MHIKLRQEIVHTCFHRQTDPLTKVTHIMLMCYQYHQPCVTVTHSYHYLIILIYIITSYYYYRYYQTIRSVWNTILYILYCSVQLFVTDSILDIGTTFLNMMFYITYYGMSLGWKFRTVILKKIIWFMLILNSANVLQQNFILRLDFV